MFMVRVRTLQSRVHFSVFRFKILTTRNSFFFDFIGSEIENPIRVRLVSSVGRRPHPYTGREQLAIRYAKSREMISTRELE